MPHSRLLWNISNYVSHSRELITSWKVPSPPTDLNQYPLLIIFVFFDHSNWFAYQTGLNQRWLPIIFIPITVFFIQLAWNRLDSWWCLYQFVTSSFPSALIISFYSNNSNEDSLTTFLISIFLNYSVNNSDFYHQLTYRLGRNHSGHFSLLESM